MRPKSGVQGLPLGIARVNGLFERQSGANRARLESGDRVWMCDPCQAEEGLRGRHRLLSPVVAEHELAPAPRLTMHLLALSSGVAARPRVHLLRDGFVHCRRARDRRDLVIRGSKERLFVAEALLTAPLSAFCPCRDADGPQSAPTLVLEKARFYWCKLGGADAPPTLGRS